MMDLGTLPGGAVSVATAVNNFGQVVGYGQDASLATHAFVWDNNEMADLGTLGGPSSHAYHINNLGDIAGSCDIETDNCHACLWSVDIPPPDPQALLNALSEAVQNLVDAGILNRGQGNSLVSKIEAANRQLDRENIPATVNILNALINQVEAFVQAGILSAAEGQTLIDLTTETIGLIQG
jgi:probable HAF family extracellular repeat protein